MQKRVFIFFLILQIPWYCPGQIPYAEASKATFASVVPSTPASATDLYTSQKQLLALLPDAFQKNSPMSEQAFKEVFLWTQRHIFHQFAAYTPIEALIEKGTYNCVSGTLFYALLLEHYQVPFAIYETLDHAYLIAFFGKRKTPVLIESTLKEQGWIADKSLIEQREAHYLRQSKSNFKVSIRSSELAALQLYNLAVVAYNQKEYRYAQQYLRQTYILYPSIRVEALYRMALAKTQAAPLQAIAQGKSQALKP